MGVMGRPCGIAVLYCFYHLAFVHSVPVFTRAPSTNVVYVPPDGSLSIVCATKDPSTITWHQDTGNRTTGIIAPAKANITNKSDRSSQLHLENARKLSIFHLIPLFCRATDSSGSTNSSSFRLVNGDAPTFGIEPVGHETTGEGNDVVNECSYASGTPIPDITWTFVRKGTFVAVKVGQDSNKTRSNYIRLPNISRKSAGTYTCKIENIFGSVMASKVVIVKYPPEVSIQFYPSSTVRKGDSVTVICRSQSSPMTVSHALLSPLQSTDLPDTVEWRYTITASDEAKGMYQCSGQNAVTSRRSNESQLVVLSPPDEPTVKASNMSDVCWTAGYRGHPAVVIYLLSCTTQVNSACGSKQPFTVNMTKGVPATALPSDILCVNLPDYSPHARYTCTITASNGAFDIFTKTAVSLEPGKPGPVTLNEVLPENVGNTEFTLNWCVSFTGGIPLTSTVLGVPDGSTVNHNYNTSNQQWKSTVKNLEPGTTFKVKVKVTNSEGEAESNEVTVKTTCVPDDVLVANAEVDSRLKTISFVYSRTGPCSTYVDFIVRNGETVWRSTATRDGNRVTIHIHQIGTYSLTITAMNRKGNRESAKSKAITIREEFLMVGVSHFDCLSVSCSILGEGGIIAVIVFSIVVVIQFIVIGFTCRKLRKRQTANLKENSMILVENVVIDEQVKSDG